MLSSPYEPSRMTFDEEDTLSSPPSTPLTTQRHRLAPLLASVVSRDSLGAARHFLRHRHAKLFYGMDGAFGPTRLPSNPASIDFLFNRAWASHEVASFVDFGAGYGRVLLGCALFRPSARVRGVEVNADVASVAAANLCRLRKSFLAAHPSCKVAPSVEFEVSDIEDLVPGDFGDVTHAVCMWTGMTLETQAAFLRLVVALPRLRSVAMPYHPRFRDLPSETHRTTITFGRTRGTLQVFNVGDALHQYVAGRLGVAEVRAAGSDAAPGSARAPRAASPRSSCKTEGCPGPPRPGGV